LARCAELNYNHMSERVQEGVASQLELREASDQLDQSRLNYLQAVHDYLVARTDLETALGQPLTPTSESYLMTRR
jgi:outer membrane protein TolC